VRVVFLPHARERMKLRGIAEEEARAALEKPVAGVPRRPRPDRRRAGLPGRRLATKVVYNLGTEQERIVVTVERGRPRGGKR
jgi:hypothetical protein